jgi:hypothetical protein
LKKAKHKYKLGDKLKFKYFDGGIRTGKVTKIDYVHLTPTTTDWSIATYTITTYNLNLLYIKYAHVFAMSIFYVK